MCSVFQPAFGQPTDLRAPLRLPPATASCLYRYLSQTRITEKVLEALNSEAMFGKPNGFQHIKGAFTPDEAAELLDEVRKKCKASSKGNYYVFAVLFCLSCLFLYVKSIIEWKSIRGLEVEVDHGHNSDGKRQYMTFEIKEKDRLCDLQKGLDKACETFYVGGKSKFNAEMLCLDARGPKRQGDMCPLPYMHIYLITICWSARMCCLALHADYRLFAKDVIAGEERALIPCNIPASAIICIQEG